MPTIYYPGADDEPSRKPTAVDPAIWDIRLLNRLLTECRVYAQPDPADPGEPGNPRWLLYPGRVNGVILQVINLLCAATDAKARLGLRWREPGMTVTRN